jgi:tetratricopeptide (TPR) repeat protein
MAEIAPAPPRRRDVRAWAISLTLALTLLGGWVLERWINRGTEGMAPAQHVAQKRRDEVDARFKQGVVMLHAKQFDHAMTAFHRVLELAPEMPEAHVNMGFALIGQRKYKAALDFFNSATELNPNQINAYFGMAESYEGLQDYRGAVEAMETFLHRAKPDDPFRRRAESAVWEWRERLRTAQPEARAPPAAR